MKRILQITAIVALTVLFLWLFLRNANLSEVGAILRAASPGWILIGFVANYGALILRTIRWRTILDPDDPPPFSATFFANAVGYMFSIILPIRASDVARPALLARRTTHRFSAALGTMLIERLLDLTSILGLFVVFAFLRWSEFSHDPDIAKWFYIVRAGAVAAVLMLALLAFFILGLVFFRAGIRRLHEKIGRILPLRVQEPWMHFFDSFTDALALTRHHAAFARVLLCTAGTWMCLNAQFWLATRAVKRTLPFDSSFFVTGVTTIGLAIPTPGGIGGFHKACQLVLTHFYRFDIDSSIAIAVIFHLIGTLPVLITGLLLFAKEGLRWKDVTRT